MDRHPPALADIEALAERALDAIPPELKQRWTLILGRSQEELPPLLERLGTIDSFMHDSEHSFECVRIAQISNDQVAPAHELTMPAGHIIEDHGVQTAFRKLLAHVRANITRAAADKNFAGHSVSRHEQTVRA